MPRITTVEQTDEVIQRMIESVKSNAELYRELRREGNWGRRWVKLEKYVEGNLGSLGLDYTDYQLLWIRERFFFDMQKETGMDFGFCENYVPQYRNRAVSILTQNLNIDMRDICTYEEKKIETLCSGTDRDVCVFRKRELEELEKMGPVRN